MTRWLPGRMIAITVAIGLVLTGCTGGNEMSTPGADPVLPLAFGNVVTASGKVVPARWATLSFETGGQVAWLAAEGSQVAAEEVLALLDAPDLEHAVAQAQAALATAQAQLAVAVTGATPEEIAAAEGAVVVARGGVASAEAALAQAELGAEIARASLKQAAGVVAAAEAALVQAQGTLDAARADLDSAEAGLAQVVAGTSDEDLLAAQLDVEAAQVELAQLQDADETAIEIARLNWEMAKTSLWQAQLERDATQSQSVPGYQKELANAAVGVAESSARIAELDYQQAQDGASDEEVRLAEIAVSQAEVWLEELASLASDEEMAIARAAVDAARARVQTSEAGEDAAEAALAQAEAALEAAQTQVAQADAGVMVAEAQVEVAEGQLVQAEAGRDRLKAGATREEISVLEGQVAQAEASLAQAETALVKARLVAPFAGTVGAVHLREGEIIVPGTPVLVLGDASMLRVETTDLNEVDAARVAVGGPVTLTFDALPERAVKGQIVRIAPMATVSQGGTNFMAVIDMTSPPEALRWGMTAFVDIEVD